MKPHPGLPLQGKATKAQPLLFENVVIFGYTQKTRFKMKTILLSATTLIYANVFSQSIKSDVYAWKNFPVEKKEITERRKVVDGSGAMLANLEIHATTLYPKTGPQPKNRHEQEVMIIVKEGKLKISIEEKSKTMGPGSVAFAIPAEEISVENMGDTKTIYYVFKFTAKKDSINLQRARDAGGSFFIDFNDIEFKQHDKGGVRQYFNRPTAMMRRFDIHVTTLNAGLKSHDPHTHKAEEMVLMMDGNAEMQIADSFKRATSGDLIYLESMIPHAIKNDDTKPIMYFAIQWE
jgi:(S)-ureidoglycine aminohydrolase